MKISRSRVPTVIMSLMLLNLLILANPPSGLAQNPHACVNFTTHLGTKLGGVTTFPFQFAKNCNGYWSNAITWNFLIQNVTNPTSPVTVCNAPWGSVPTNGRTTLNCPGLIVGAPYRVVINYTVPPNTLMVHSHNVLNTP